MKWDGKIGPTFLITCALIVAQTYSWAFGTNAAIDRRIAIMETTLAFMTPRIERIENKLDTLKAWASNGVR